jgi:hypothetical protein
MNSNLRVNIYSKKGFFDLYNLGYEPEEPPLHNCQGSVPISHHNWPNTTQHNTGLFFQFASYQLCFFSFRVQKIRPHNTRTKSNLCVPQYKIHKWSDCLFLVSTTIVVHTYMRFKNIYNCKCTQQQLQHKKDKWLIIGN